MQLTVQENENGIKTISLIGRMDIPGTSEIDTRLAVETASETRNVIVDLSRVDFMASIGIGVLVRAANALRRRGGKVVLLNPQPVVALVLEKTQINTILPVVHSVDAARAALGV